MSYQRQWFDEHDFLRMRVQQNDLPGAQPFGGGGSFMDLSQDALQEEAENSYWRNMYPSRMRRIQECVEDECDKMDYDGSAMYDEYPDRITLYRIGSNIYRLLMEEELFAEPEEMEEEEIADDELYEMNQLRGPGPVRPPRPPHPPRPYPPHPPRPPHRPGNNWLRDAIDVLLYQEMCKRRKCHRDNRRRYWF